LAHPDGKGDYLMFKLGLAMKWILGILFGFGAVTAMAYYAGPNLTSSIYKFPKSIYEYLWKKPKAPVIVDQYVEGGCGARVHWTDNALDEDGVYFYRRVVGEPDFAAIKITEPHPGIPGSFDDHNLPIGTYEYRVSVFNEYGQSYSNISEQIVIDNEACGNEPLLIKPLNPIITAVAVEGNCKARIWYSDNSVDEDGVRIYRYSFVDPNFEMIDELGPHAGVPGSYDDPNLPPTTYSYQVSVFNANGESFSNVSDDVVINDPDCEPLALIDPEDVILSPTATSTPQSLAKACIWKAAISTFVRTGPGASLYPDITAVEPGTELSVIGQSEDEFFWVVEVDSEVPGYVPKADRFGEATGDCDVPIVPDPKAPEISPSSPECSDGVDNDGDRRIDYVPGAAGTGDRECSGPNDPSEN
jgi:hypothetical protein